MHASFSVDLAVHCTACDAECVIPGKAERVLVVDGVIYSDYAAPVCEACGGTRLRSKVIIDDGSEEEHEGSGPPESGHR